MYILYYNTPIYREILLQFFRLQRNIMPTECLFILDAVLEPCRSIQHDSYRRSAQLVLGRLEDDFILRSELC